MNLTPVRRASAAAVVLTLSLALTACGGDEEPTDDPTSAESEASDDPEEPSPETPDEPEEPESGAALTDDELAGALLTVEDLPGYVVEPESDEDSESFAGTCLEAVGEITDRPEFEADGEAEISFVLEGAAGQTSIQSQVQSYEDEEQVITAIALFSEVVGACEGATGTDPDGTSYDLRVQSDQQVSLEGVDEQARVAISGTITTNDLDVPIDIGYNVARIANNIVIITTLDAGEVDESIVEQTDVTAQISVDRLAEITGG